MACPADDWNLLFGLLAVRLGAISPGALAAAQAAWLEAPGRPLSLILVERGDLAPADLARVEEAVRRHAEVRDTGRNDPEAATEVDPEVADFVVGEPVAGGGVMLETTVFDPGGSPEAGPPSDDETTILASASDPAPSSSASSSNGRRRSTPPGPRFRAVQPHARGGLGEVHVAWDGELDRYVALKEIRREYAQRDDLRARFVREAEINGNLEHPGVVPVYGLGTHDDGRPYYAMRFVRGESLESAIRRFHAGAAESGRSSRWSLELRQLLGHFLDVCDAIAYAHSRGVIHRDIKPANVLLGDYGETLIIDWGLAKVVDDDEPEAVASTPEPGASEASGPPNRLPADGGLASTVAGETLGSPPFMSPEQAAGRNDEVGRASDVYGLGATLYALLTGVPPVAGESRKEIVAKAARGAITPPRSANPRVPTALAAVCLKALAREPGDRYETARALADDVRRWLADEPVSVHEDSLGTRLLRWSRRHRPLVAAALAVLVVGVVGLAVATGIVGEQKRRAVIARDEAIAARQLARDHLRIGLDVVDQLVTLGDRQLIAQQTPGVRNRFLETAVTFIRRFREREPDDSATRLQTAALARRLANLYRLTGRFAEADSLYEEAASILGDPRRLLPADPRAAELLAGTRIDRGESLLMRGRAREAAGEFAGAVELARGLVGLDPSVGDYQRALVRGLYHQSAALLASGNDDAAGPAAEAIDLIRPLADSALRNARNRVQAGEIRPLFDQLDLVHALDQHAAALEAAGQIERAEDDLVLALERMDQLVAQFQGDGIPDILHLQPWVATRLARLRLERDGPGGATDLLDPAIARLEHVVQLYREIWNYRTTLADARLTRALAHEQAGRLAEAQDDATAARDGLKRLLDAFPAVPEHASLLAEALDRLAHLALRADPPRREEARQLLEEAIRHQQAALRASPESPMFRERLTAHQSSLGELEPASP